MKMRFPALIWAGFFCVFATAQQPYGFVDARMGWRTGDDPFQETRPLTELRLQTAWNQLWSWGELQVTLDAVLDEVADDREDIDWERGQGWADLRELYLLMSPFTWMDVKLGRQILTWGTGDLLFINDLFPKDWQSFFAGRDEAYLKAPSDAVFISLFPGPVNLDIAYMPRFDADRFISGTRFSYYNPMLGRIAGNDAVIEPIVPDSWGQDSELALRLYRNLGGVEVAGYGYSGFWKSPSGFDPQAGSPLFPPLQVAGISARWAWGKALVNGELGYLDTQRSGQKANAQLPPDEWRLLLGYERELARNFTAAFQYYLEKIDQVGGEQGRPDPGSPVRDEYRHVFSLRMTRLAMNQNLKLSFFSYYSPSDSDGYARPMISYQYSDRWRFLAGGNVFWGQQRTTFFGQFEDNSNVYLGVRYSY